LLVSAFLQSFARGDKSGFSPPDRVGVGTEARLPDGQGPSCGTPPTRVFWEKRLQAVENKGRESEKESKEAPGD